MAYSEIILWICPQEWDKNNGFQMISVDFGSQNMVIQQFRPLETSSFICFHTVNFRTSCHVDKSSAEGKNENKPYVSPALRTKDFFPFPSKNVLNVSWKLSKISLLSR